MPPFINNDNDEASIHTEASLDSLLAEDRGNRNNFLPPMPSWMNEIHSVDEELNVIG